jgi:hypothetical protein
MLLIAPMRNAQTTGRLGRKWGAPQSIGMKCRNPSPRPNEMSELLAAPEVEDGVLLIGPMRNAQTPGRLGRKWGAPQSIGMNCRNPSLRPNEMSELLTAPNGGWDAPHRIRREGGTSSPPREEIDCPSEHRSEMSEPLTSSQ